MKLIQALKKQKELAVKADDLRGKIRQHCVHYNTEQPLYGSEQKKTIDGWIQSVSDIIAEQLGLRIAIQKTNLDTEVTMEIGGKHITKSIAEWIHRRRDLANEDRTLWMNIGDRNLRDEVTMQSNGEKIEKKVVRYYDPAKRDEMVAMFRAEPGIIDSTLEVINATTELQI